MSINRGMDKEGMIIYMMEYYSAIKKNDIMPFVATWMDQKSVIPSEISQTEKEKYHMTSLICGFKKEIIQMNLQNRKTVTNST